MLARGPQASRGLVIMISKKPMVEFPLSAQEVGPREPAPMEPPQVRKQARIHGCSGPSGQPTFYYNKDVKSWRAWDYTTKT